jgi:uncharacterized membrane protein YfcA
MLGEYELMLIMFGLGVGLLVGATGVGGGSIMTPLLVLVGVPPVSAVATDLFYAAVTKTVGGFSHFRNQTVDLRLSLQLAIGSVPAAILAVLLLSRLESLIGVAIDVPLIIAIALAIGICGVAMVYQSVRPTPADPARGPARPLVAAIVSGAIVGFVLGLTSAGSGSVLALLLIVVFRLLPHRVVGTDIFHAALLLWAAALVNILIGNVDFALAGLILAGSIPGVLIGARIAFRLPALGMRLALAAVLLAAAGSLTVKAGLPLPPVALVAWFAVLGVGALILYRRIRTPSLEAA